MLATPALTPLQVAARNEKRATAVLWSGCIAYGVAAAVLIAHQSHHFQLAVIALQFFILLPAALFSLHLARTANSVPFSLRGKIAARAYVVPFLAAVLVTGWIVGRGVLIPDESAYRFQATVFANGEIAAPAPTGAIDNPDTPHAVNFAHQVVDSGRWFSKYPVGWPAVLALPEKLHIGWAAAPLLGAFLLVIAGLIARETFGATAVAPSLWIAALSPFWLATCVGRLSEALCAVLVATACLYCLRATHARSLRNFALMYAFLVPAFLVRPYTALVASVVYGVAALLWSWRDRRMFLRVGALSIAAGALAIALTAALNVLYTGNALLSPYALYKGRAVPTEITASPERIFYNLVHGWRLSAQSIVAYSFPLVFLLAAHGLWSRRRSWQAWILAALFPALVIAYLADALGPSSLVGERYWFEGFVGIAVLGGQGVATLISRWRIPKRVAVAGVAGITCAQVALTAATAGVLYSYSQPYAVMRAAAERFQNCNCAVFVADTPLAFYSRNMNLNTANWRHAGVFYFNDPGPEQRQMWANRYGWHRWVVIDYDPATQSATTHLFHDRPGQLLDEFRPGAHGPSPS